MEPARCNAAGHVRSSKNSLTLKCSSVFPVFTPVMTVTRDSCRTYQHDSFFWDVSTSILPLLNFNHRVCVSTIYHNLTFSCHATLNRVYGWLNASCCTLSRRHNVVFDGWSVKRLHEGTFDGRLHVEENPRTFGPPSEEKADARSLARLL